ncbi:bifunctional UDP-N-acetylglucosamine diphosphorylase/glucosamine-1-phosphate N-acetyltransferase GlmU [Halobacillus salinarum]|uniref:Bifunctional UDP-N-acetylglucosamine diphosphorylase/glucosamine-1-phosphate N-acetyltransferase GlmU n=1 Tax=Halobacillus salinarum TaxID=2932257 RepID=A0ABY4EQ19_9BACI|nr:bifunctional UDP-N-acetylglucosamine diphosphorylase/glucosamine-1-phosphate N-acetyltransferase GlmU [Halobacillus salinarum]UOQ46537.1 bifunctional UDP-N-acetylglucosamine diphosphorylase/glucosamine-1-phosphate N-acetyltransferase GlmU [Halobacillus salinarum]
MQRFAVILAAGKGTRMKSDLPKVLHTICGQPMVQHVIDQLTATGVKEIITIVGHQSEMVKNKIGPSVHYAFQEEQLGTAHAVKMSSSLLEDKKGTTLVITGDTPLITSETLERCFDYHEESKAAATVITMSPEDPSGYGRIVRNDQGGVERIVEHKDADEKELQIQEVNTGIFCFDNELLFASLEQVSSDNSQGEYYLPDVIEILKEQGRKIAAIGVHNLEEGFGINDRTQLARAEKILQKRILVGHMKNGVTIIDPDSTYIETEVTIGKDTVIQPHSYLRGHTRIGEKCVIGPNVDLIDYRCDHNTKIQNFSMTNDISAIPYV